MNNQPAGAATWVIVRALIAIALGTSVTARGEDIPAGGTSILSIADHERIYAPQKQIDQIAYRAKSAAEEIAALRGQLGRAKDEFETTEAFKARQDELSNKIGQIKAELLAAQAKENELKRMPLPTRMIVTFAYVSMGPYDADSSRIAGFSSPIPADGTGSSGEINDPYPFGDIVEENRGNLFATRFHYRVVSVKGQFAGITCPPAVAKKIRDASSRHRLLARVLIPVATTVCKRETVDLHHVRLSDLEPGLERLKATAKMFASNNRIADAEVIKIEVRGDAQVTELLDGETSLWKAEKR